MPVSPADTIDLARAISVLYEDAEDALFGLVSQALAEGIDSPRWAEAKLHAIGDLRRALEDVTRALQRDATGAISAAVEEAYRRGGQAAVAELGALAEGHRAFVARHLPGASAADRLARAAVQEQGPTWGRILREPLDIYRSVVARVAATPLLGALTRRQAAGRVLDQFAARGVTSFTDTAGRRWNMASYAEMAMRSVTARAAITGHVEQLTALGQQLVIVSDAPLECPLCRPWEGEVLAINGASGPHTLRLPHAIQPTGLRAAFRPLETVAVHVAGSLPEARAAGLLHPNCFPGDVLVSAPSGVRAADARWYEGDLIVIHTASGEELSVTPNHPVLTPEGWVTAGALEVGSRVLRYDSGSERVDGVRPDDEHVPAQISEVFDALRQASPVPPVHVPGAAEQFHGDGGAAEVSVVLADSLLRNGLDAEQGELSAYRQLLLRGVGRGALLAASPALQVVTGADHAADGLVCGRHLGSALLGTHGGPLPGLGLTAADLSAPLDDPPADARLADAEGGRQLALALASAVTADQVIDIGRREFAGHVYNLQTGDGWYVAGGLVVHNCRHSLSVFLPGVTQRPESPPHPQGATYEDTQRQRYYERQVRAWKRRAAASMTDADRRRANARARAYQARIRALVADKGLFRQPAREQITSAR